MDPETFGVKGDGKADDTAALQRAINETKGELALGPGTYRITKALVVDLKRRGRTVIRGCGARILNEAPDAAIILLGSHKGTADPKTISREVWERESTPMISGIEIEGAHPQADGIRIEFTWQPVIMGVCVHDCRHGIHVVKNNRNVIISNSHVYHNRGVGVFLDRVNLHQVIVNTNHISYNAGGGIKVLEANVRNLQICGNDIEYNRGEDDAPVGDVWFIADKIGIREGTIVGNTIQSTITKDGANVRIEGLRAEGTRKAGLITITGNLITNQRWNILVRDSRGIAIQGNTFLLGPERNIRLDRCDHISIGPNTIDDNPDYARYNPSRDGGVEIADCRGCSLTGLIVRGAPCGITIRDSSDINVTGCTVIEPKDCGIELNNVRNSVVSGCIVSDGGGEKTMSCGIREAGDSSANVITGNRVAGGAVEVSSGGTVCTNNLVTQS